MRRTRLTPVARTHAADGLLLLVLVPMAALVGWSFWGYSYDDAFITYRYAANWAARGELAFNPGEVVLGTSAPGYALALGVLSRAVGLDAPALGTLLALGALVGTALILRAALADAAPNLRGSAPLLFGVAALVFRWNQELLGAEAFPVLALASLATWLALGRRRSGLAGICASGAALLRFDAVLLAVILGLALWIRERRFPVRYAATATLGLAMFVSALSVHFGSALPTTLAAKRAERALVSRSYSAEQARWLLRCLPPSGCLTLLVLAATGTVVAARAAPRSQWRARAAATLAAWVVVHEAAYRVLDVPFAPWYHVTLVNLLLLAAVLGALALAGQALHICGRPASTAWSLTVAGLLMLPVLGPGARYLVVHWGQPPDPRYEAYVAAGHFLRVHARTGATVAAVEVGIVGYTSGLRVLDLLGLVTPSALAARQAGALPHLVAREAPEFIVDATLFRASYLDAILDQAGIAGAYRVVAVLPDGRGAPLAVRLLQRIAHPKPPGEPSARAPKRDAR